MRPGARLVVSIPGSNDHGSFGFDEVLGQANATLAEMVSDGAISADERTRMVHGGIPRRLSDLVAPFASDPHFAGLSLERSKAFPAPDVAWEAFQRDGDREALARGRALFFHVTFGPTLAGALENFDDAERRRVFIRPARSWTDAPPVGGISPGPSAHRGGHSGEERRGIKRKCSPQRCKARNFATLTYPLSCSEAEERLCHLTSSPTYRAPASHP